MRRVLVVVAAAGCGFEGPSRTRVDAPPIDALDAPGTMACPWPYAPTGFDPCVGVPSGTLPDLDLHDPGTYHYDTTDGSLTPPTGADIGVPSTVTGGARVLWTRSFRIGDGATLRVTGDNPFVIVSQSAVILDGTVDVGSHRVGPNNVGAGSDLGSTCTGGEGANGMVCMHGGSGGGGGGFGGTGAPGGVGGLTHDCMMGATAGIPGGPGGTATTDTSLRGGCDGGDGANGDGSQGGGGGIGGGAIHLVARDQLLVSMTGKVLAGGAGGTGGNNGRSGGGAGGSGGLIVLAGTTIEVAPNGVLAANGGAGGGGSNASQAGHGADGQPSLLAAVGGTPEGNSGTGGNGATGAAEATVGTGVDRGGGGGGGGVGKIRLTVKAGNTPVTSNAMISPAATP